MTLVEWFGFLVVAGNEPQARPGAYVISQIVSRKCYVGIGQNVRTRVLGHGKGDGSQIIYRAIAKYGRSLFLVEPIYYSLAGTNDLAQIEAQLIKDWTSLAPKGYNIIAASGKVGPYGPEHGRLISEHHATPQAKAKASASQQAWADARRGKPIIAFTAEVRAEATRQMIITKRTPSFRLSQSRRSRALRARSDVREKWSLSWGTRIWITDGVNNRRILISDAIPDGWRPGAKRKPRKVSHDDLNEIRELLAQGIEGKCLAQKYNVSRSLISRIKNHKKRIND